MIKLVVSSFYNTLINDDESIDKSTMIEIDRIRKKGIIFAVATNRNYKEVLDYNKDFDFIDYIISLNGSYIYDVKKERCIYKKKISLSNIKKISSLYSDYNINYYLENEIVDSEDKINDKEVFKIEIEINSIEDIKKISKLKVNHSIFQYNDKKYLEITSANASMFTGVDQISLKNNLNLKEILSINANESDYSLVTNIPHAYVVKNGSGKLKKATKKRTYSNNEKGLERLLKKL